ncbi:ALF repeat-containing protein [Streptomyces turgidiscabies]|uniref:Uncharacterized protein n=1 Tax=Streptomyces turgidiscabies TaxID=85558 RepID=A0ABU0RMP6_9ACTN|nr:ALF repeat-containing protein [Streptomyces turgidiscabies]MDQ0933262.1 hypothetical protein [Streptomyces turgidiscabies]
MRVEVENLWINSPSAKLRTAAGDALLAEPSKVGAFLTEGQYETMEQDVRVYIAQVTDAGGPVVKERGRAALASGSVSDLRDFATAGQYEARGQDERVVAAQLIDSGGPEVKAAARIALEGPAPLLHAFVETGQYMARRRTSWRPRMWPRCRV